MYISSMVVELSGSAETVARDARRLADSLSPLPVDPPAFSNTLTVHDVVTICGFLAAGQKIAAIKHFRQLTGWGLKESKDAIEGNHQF